MICIFEFISAIGSIISHILKEKKHHIASTRLRNITCFVTEHEANLLARRGTERIDTLFHLYGADARPVFRFWRI